MYRETIQEWPSQPDLPAVLVNFQSANYSRSHGANTLDLNATESDAYLTCTAEVRRKFKFVDMHMHICAHTHALIFVPCICTCMHAYVHMYMHIYACMYMHVHRCARARVHAHMYMCSTINAYTCTYVQVPRFIEQIGELVPDAEAAFAFVRDANGRIANCAGSAWVGIRIYIHTFT